MEEILSLPLIPEHDINLILPKSADGDRFIELFRYVWKQITVEDQDRILQHWKGDPHGPEIALNYCNLSFFGQVLNEGHRLLFDLDCYIAFDDKELRFAIAHELGHVSDIANGFRKTCNEKREKVNKNEKTGQILTDFEFENSADRWAASWGFPRNSP